MPPIFKPEASRGWIVASSVICIVALALNRWDFSENTSTTPAVMFMALITLGIGACAVSILASQRVRDAVIQQGVDFRSVRVRFVVVAGIALILGAIECLVVLRRFS
jgi:hypothetical protein